MPENMLQERDVMVVMRDGVRIAADIYRPGAPGRFPALRRFIPLDRASPQDGFKKEPTP